MRHYIPSSLELVRLGIAYETMFTAVDGAFVPPEALLARLEADGRVAVNKAAEDAKLKNDMRCPFTGQPLRNIPAVKGYVESREYRKLCFDSAGGAGSRVGTSDF